MKTKHLIIVSLLLAIITMGVVSASENVTADDGLATSDITEDPIEEASADESTLGEENYVGGFEIGYSDSVPVNYEYGVIYISNSDAEGNITVSVDNKIAYDEEFTGYVDIYIDDLNITSPKEYDLLVNFVPVTGNALTLANYKLLVTEEEADIGIDASMGSFVDVSYTYEFENEIASVELTDYELNGNLTLYIDGKLYYNKTVGEVDIGLSDLTEIPPIGKYLVELKYYDGKNLTLIKSRLIKFGYYMSISDLEHGPHELEIGSDVVLDLSLPYDATGSLYVILNDKEYKAVYKNGDGNVTVSTENLDLGKVYSISMVLRNDPKYPEDMKTYQLTTIPNLVFPDYMSVGETDFVAIALPSKYAGTLCFYNAKFDEDEGEYVAYGSLIANVTLVNGKATVKFSESEEGSFNYIVEYKNGNYSYFDYFDVDVVKNNNGISATVEPTTISAGGSVTLKLTGPKDLNEYFDVYVDGVRQDKPLNFFNIGVVSQSIKFTTPGEHSIKVLSDGIYSNTFYVTVKEAPAPAKKADTVKLTLKKVKVKKSAKKLVLQATLKINGKAVKGKVIKFKFNKKTYKAKTNKKGVAKVTVKKSVLKKLKVGKKVKIQATYGKTTKKLTVKVKK